MKLSHISLIACSMGVVFAFTNLLHANGLELNLYQSGADGYHSYHPQDGTSGSFSGSFGGSYSHGEGSVGYGYASLHAYGRANASSGGSFQAAAGWQDDYIITPADSSLLGTPGTATFTYHLAGKDTVIHTGYSGSGAHFDLDIAGTSLAYELDNGSGFSVPLSNFSTINISVGFTFGSLFSVPVHVSAGAGPSGNVNPEASVDITIGLTGGGMSVMGAGNSAVAYTLSSHTGAARGSNIASGGGYSGFTWTNTNAGSHGTQMSLLGGTASNDTGLNAAFSPAPAGSGLVSDILSFSGTGSDKFVLQLSYDEAAAMAQFGGEENVALLWRNPANGLWTNSVFGNSDGGAAQQHFVGAYDPNTEFVLGNYGVDSSNNIVWAVIDHNSDFAVGYLQAVSDAVPQPVFTGISLSGANLVITGTNGLAGEQYTLLHSTNMAEPLSQWTPVATNTFGGGNFSITNPANPSAGQNFYLLRVPL